MKKLKWYMAPVFWVDDLAEVMKELHPGEDWDNLREIMFGDQYMNDVYVSFYLLTRGSTLAKNGKMKTTAV